MPKKGVSSGTSAQPVNGTKGDGWVNAFDTKNVQVSLSIIAAIVAGLYAIGWLTRFIAISRFGLGGLEFSRQSAVASGATLGFAMTPLILGAFGVLREKDGIKDLWQYLCVWGFTALVWLMATAGFVDYFGAPANRWLPIHFSFVFACILFQSCLLTELILTRKGSPSLQGVFFTVVAAWGVLWSYSRLVLAVVPPALGGFYYQPVELVLKDPPLVMRSTLIDSDQQGLFLFRDDRGYISDLSSGIDDEITRPIIRIPWSRVVQVAKLDHGSTTGK